MSLLILTWKVNFLSKIIIEEHFPKNKSLGNNKSYEKHVIVLLPPVQSR